MGSVHNQMENTKEEFKHENQDLCVYPRRSITPKHT